MSEHDSVAAIAGPPVEGGPTGEGDRLTLTVGSGAEAREIAVLRRSGVSPGLFWMGGFRSDMTGTKANALDGFASETNRAFARFDYSGHGRSGGRFEDGTISRWLEESEAVFERLTEGPQVIVGSSMGGYIALLLATRRAGAVARRVKGLVLLAPAIDMTEMLIWAAMPRAARRQLETTGVFQRPPGTHSDESYPITRALIEDGRKHLFGDRLIETGCPVHILQGMTDDDVPWQTATKLTAQFASDDVVLTLIRDGDHRLSRPEDIERIKAAVTGLIDHD